MPTNTRKWALLLALLLASPFIPLQHPGAARGPAAAQSRSAVGGNPAVGSIVGCIRDGDQVGTVSSDAPRFAATCFASLLHYDSYQSSDGTLGDAPPTDAALVQFGDTKPDSRFEPAPPTFASVGAVGAVYGIAYASGRNPAAAGTPGAYERLFVAAYTKRGTRFGALGPGGIYTYAARYADSATDPRTVRPYLVVPNVVQGPKNGAAPTEPGDGTASTFPDGTATATYHPGRGGIHTPYDIASQWDETDPTAVGLVGRTALGDIDLDPDERVLYVVNLRDKRVYAFDTWSSDPQRTLHQLPHFPNLASGTACGASRNAQPFALHVTRAWLYLGVTCTADSTQNPADLGLRVWRYDRSRDGAGPAVGAWDTTPALVVSLASYAAQRNNGTSRQTAWRPWTNSVPCGGSVGSFSLCPQPLLTDIEFDEQGAMLLGLRDRFGDLSGMDPLPRGIPAGDLMRARPDPTSAGRWLQPDASSAGEYFDDRHTIEDSLEDKTEVAAGGLAYVPGNRAGGVGEVVTTWLDPYEPSSFGTAWFDAGASGRPTAREQLYPKSSSLRYFGKATGLGDVELLCAWSAIGDRVWNDANANGVQDGGEGGIGGVTVQLFDAADSAFTRPLATATTGDVNGDGATGDYRFYVEPWRRYTVRLEPTQFHPVSGALRGWLVTREGQGDDTRDSDADPHTRVVGPVEPRSRGEHDPSLDFGLTQVGGTAVLGDRVWLDADADGQQEPGERGVPGVRVSIAGCGDPARLNCSEWDFVAETATDADGRYFFRNLAPNRYSISVALPSGYLLTRADVGDDARDSDIAAGQTRFDPIAVTWDEYDDTYDVGLTPLLGDAQVQIEGPSQVLQGQPADYIVRVTGGTAPMLNVPLDVAITPGALSVSSADARVHGSPAEGFALAWTIPVLPAGQSETRAFRVIYRDIDDETITATMRPDPPDADQSNDRSGLRTLVVSPNVAITQDRRERVGPGEAFTYRLAITNRHFQDAGAVPSPFLVDAPAVTVTNTLPPGVDYQGFASSGSAELLADTGPSSGPRTLTWLLSSLPARGSQTIDIHVRVADRAPLPLSLRNRAEVSTGALTTAADGQADNVAEQETLVDYPDLAVDIRVDGSDGPLTRGEGGALVYTVRYDNLLGLEAAEGVSLTLTLPREVTPGSPSNGAFTAGTAPDGRRTLTWSLGTLAPGMAVAAIDVPVTVNLGAAEAGPLRARATIGTTTAEPVVDNNHDSLDVLVVAPPRMPDIRGSDRVRLAIHSALDPKARTANAVYVSDGPEIAWPAGEVLDFTPLAAVELPALTDEQRAFYLVRATITGWRLVSFEGPRGMTMAAGTATTDRDVFWRSGCRGSGVPSGETADGCGYRYLGASVTTSDAPGSPPLLAPAQADMASQAHVYWSNTPPPAMRADVYTLAAPGLPAVSLRLEVLVRVEVAARASGVVVRSEDEAQRVSQVFRVRLVAPRSAR